MRRFRHFNGMSLNASDTGDVGMRSRGHCLTDESRTLSHRDGPRAGMDPGQGWTQGRDGPRAGVDPGQGWTQGRGGPRAGVNACCCSNIMKCW